MFTIFDDTVSIDIRSVVSIVVERLGSIDDDGLVSIDCWLCVSIDDKVVASSDVDVDLYGWCVPNEQDRLRTSSLSPCCFWCRWACT